ncbi:MAG: hypothetical protein Q4G34_03625 [Micrococcus sp.]|nr:hypothetical protein [Micrococcus sp.]
MTVEPPLIDQGTASVAPIRMHGRVGELAADSFSLSAHFRVPRSYWRGRTPTTTRHVLALSGHDAAAVNEAQARLDKTPAGFAPTVEAAEKWLRGVIAEIDASVAIEDDGRRRSAPHPPPVIFPSLSPQTPGVHLLFMS